jgi:hypothetical protein
MPESREEEITDSIFIRATPPPFLYLSLSYLYPSIRATETGIYCSYNIIEVRRRWSQRQQLQLRVAAAETAEAAPL